MSNNKGKGKAKHKRNSILEQLQDKITPSPAVYEALSSGARDLPGMVQGKLTSAELTISEKGKSIRSAVSNHTRKASNVSQSFLNTIMKRKPANGSRKNSVSSVNSVRMTSTIETVNPSGQVTSTSTIQTTVNPENGTEETITINESPKSNKSAVTIEEKTPVSHTVQTASVSSTLFSNITSYELKKLTPKQRQERRKKQREERMKLLASSIYK